MGRVYLQIVKISLAFILVFSVFLFFSLFQSQAYAESVWTTTTIDSTGLVGFDPSIALGSDGFARISYYDLSNGDLKFAQCTNDDCSSKNITTIDSTGNVGTASSLKIGNDGFARISYYDVTNSNLKYTQCTNADCSTRNTRTLDSTGDAGRDSSLAIGGDGFARISYFDDTSDDLEFIRCTNDSCSTNIMTTVDPTGFVGKYSSIALGTDGFPRISYQNLGTSNVKFAKCTNADCTSVTITTVTMPSTNTALALDSNNIASIATFNTSSADVRFKHCTDADCATTDATTTITAASDQDMKLDTAGYGRISYANGGVGYLMYVQCSNTSCSSNSATTIDDAGTASGTSLALASDYSARITYTMDTTLKFAKEEILPSPTPTSTPTSTANITQQSQSNTAQSSAPTCQDTKPTNTPDLFQIDVTDTRAMLYFTPVFNANKYYITYGNGQGINLYGVEFETKSGNGVVSYPINMLSPNSTYSFQVRGGNGCMPGDWGNKMQITTGGSKNITSYFKNSSPQLVSLVPNIGIQGQKKSIVLGVSTGNACEYTVKPGDSLWTISTAKFGTGVKYSEIMKENNLTSHFLQVGQLLKIKC